MTATVVEKGIKLQKRALKIELTIVTSGKSFCRHSPKHAAVFVNFCEELGLKTKPFVLPAVQRVHKFAKPLK